MVILLILIIGTTIGYDLKCPAQSEWRLRANVSCYSEDKYVCLFHLLEKKYEDNCLGSDRSSIGSKLVFQPLFNLAECNTDRYQPIVFTTLGNSECIFSKSRCDEEGQVVLDNGSSSNDTGCRCDYTKGYAFVSIPKNICFCKPSEEDCSCFRVKCTKLSPDYQCITDGEMVGNTKCQKIHPYLSHKHHNRTVQYIEANKSNIGYTHQVTLIIIAIMAVCIVIAGSAVFVSPLVSPQETITSDNERQQFIHDRLIKGECGKHHFARVILIGKNGVGKTSLMRRLLWQKKEEVTSPVSTDGVEIERCNINVKSGIWSSCHKIDDDLTRLISQVFTEKKIQAERVSKQKTVETAFFPEHLNYKTEELKKELKGNFDEEEIKTYNTPVELSSLTSYDGSEDIKNYDWVSHEVINSESSERDVKLFKDTQKPNADIRNNVQAENTRFEHSTMHSFDNERYNNEDKYEAGPANDENIDKMTFAIMKSKVYRNESRMKDMLAFCWLWDFAGQKDFYATHQVFLSKCAVFLLVTDGLEFSTTENLWSDFEDSAKYVRFWIDAIHCYWSTTKKGRLDPPIIVVCTNEDKCKDEIERKKRQDNFKESLGRVLSGQKKKEHLRSIYFVSNTEDDDNVFELIRKDISLQAKDMKDWGRDCPLKWLLFQQVLGKLKEGDVPISTTTKLQKIAKHDGIGITDVEEFRHCLQYCHDIGSVIYFDEEILKEHVILDPKWLIDAFRCLVSDKIDNIIMISDDWEKLIDTGELTDSLISTLFMKEPKLKFLENKAHLLEVMKRFDIVVNLKNSTALYMPCMMKPCSFSEVQEQFLEGGQSFHRTSWFCLEFQFLPPAFFNHILAWYIKQYDVSVTLEKGTQNERKALYRQIGVFCLDSSGCEQLVVCEGPNIIAVQVWDSRMSNKTYGDIGTNLVQCVDTLRKRYSLRISFTKTFKCKNGTFTANRKRMEDLITTDYLCSEHKANHISVDLVKPWDFSEELMLQRQKIINRRHDEERVEIDKRHLRFL